MRRGRGCPALATASSNCTRAGHDTAEPVRAAIGASVRATEERAKRPEGQGTSPVSSRRKEKVQPVPRHRLPPRCTSGELTLEQVPACRGPHAGGVSRGVRNEGMKLNPGKGQGGEGTHFSFCLCFSPSPESFLIGNELIVPKSSLFCP